MLITKEFSLLIGQGCEDRKILPGIPFEPFEGNYTVASYVRLKDDVTGEVFILSPGEKITSVGRVRKPKSKRKTRVKDAI